MDISKFRTLLEKVIFDKKLLKQNKIKSFEFEDEPNGSVWLRVRTKNFEYQYEPFELVFDDDFDGEDMLVEMANQISDADLLQRFQEI